MDIVLNTNIRHNRVFSIEDAQKALSLKKVNTPNYRYVMHRITGGSETYNDMEYDLSESSRIIDSESIVSGIFKKKRQLILKNGFELSSSSEKNLEYIRKRINEFEFVSSTTFRDFISEVVENMVNFNNCFILKFRNDDISTGQIRSLPNGKEFKPIAGLYVLAAPTIDTATHPKTGQIIKYRHRITDEFSRQFRPDDIYHIHENKRVGITIGTPPLEAVKDDIILLRSIEQDTEALIHRHSNPFMHVQVGTDKSPARVLGDGTSEVEVYSSIISDMPEEGGCATPHRVKINMLGAESQALRLETYLDYFKRRVLLGLGASETDLGGNGNKAGSAEIASESLKEEVRAYQDCISHFISNYIFNELLLESPMYASQYMIPEEERVTLKFVESDIDKKIKIESHYLNMFVSGLINKEAAIRNTEFKEEDLAPDIDPLTNESISINKNNAVKNNLKNNIIQPKKKDKLLIKDSLRYIPLTNYYTSSFEEFEKIVEEYIPIDITKNKEYLQSIFSKLDRLLSDFGLDSVNKYVELALFEIV